MDSNHCQIIADSIAGKRAVDEETFASLAVLEERLELLKKVDKAFGNISFSPVVEQLLRRKNNTIGVG